MIRIHKDYREQADDRIGEHEALQDEKTAIQISCHWRTQRIINEVVSIYGAGFQILMSHHCSMNKDLQCFRRFSTTVEQRINRLQ